LRSSRKLKNKHSSKSKLSCKKRKRQLIRL
jgi:hypothetical protein